MKRLLIISTVALLCFGLMACSNKYSINSEFQEQISTEEVEDLHDYLVACEKEASQIEKGKQAGYSAELQNRDPIVQIRWMNTPQKDLSVLESDSMVRLDYFKMGLTESPTGGNNAAYIMLWKAGHPDIEPYKKTVGRAEIEELKGLFFAAK